MFSKLHLLLSYLSYAISSRHGKGRGIHSPFLYDFVSRILFDKNPYSDYFIMDSIVYGLKRSDIVMPVHEFGAGSRKFETKYRSLKAMVRSSSIQPKYGRLLYRIARHLKPSLTIELGTSLGVSSLWLSMGYPQGKVLTLEADIKLCTFAGDLFRKHNISNIEVVNGIFDEALPKICEKYPSPEMVFIDGNHSYAPTLEYFNFFADRMEKGILVIDDIHWSKEMCRAWRTIIADPKANVTIDLYQLGIIVLDPSVTPGHYTIRF